MNQGPSNAQRVSVVIPAWNADRYLGEALQSVMDQSRPVDEVIVVDDGSTDTTADVCRRFASIRYERQANSGAGAARNRGVELTTGEYVAFLDADDLWSVHKVELQVAALQDPSVDAVFAAASNFVSPDRIEELSSLRVEERPVPAYIPSAMMVRRSVLDRHGPFSTGGLLTDWVEWYLRLLESGARIVVCPELLVRRRVHGANATMQDPDGIKAYVRMVKASINRRRHIAGAS